MTDELRTALEGYTSTVKDTIQVLKDRHNERATQIEARVAEIDAHLNRVSVTMSAGGASAPATRAAFRLPSVGEYRQLETRAQSISSDPGGGYLVVPEAGPFFDRMRPAMVVLAADPEVVDMQSDAMELPGLAGSTTVYRVGEAATLTESDVAFKAVRLSAQKYAVRTVASSEWMADANPSARQILADDHAKQLAARLDLDMLEGNSGGHIIGLRRIPGVTTTSLGANGATPTLNNITDAVYRLEAKNASMDRVAIFMHPRTWNTFSKLLDTQNRFQLAPDPTTDARRRLFGRPVFVSPQITITETVGSSTDCSYVVVADMSKVIVGRRLTLGVLYDPYSKSGTDQVVVQTLTRWDMNVLHTEAVEVLTGVRP